MLTKLPVPVSKFHVYSMSVNTCLAPGEGPLLYDCKILEHSFEAVHVQQTDVPPPDCQKTGDIPTRHVTRDHVSNVKCVYDGGCALYSQSWDRDTKQTPAG